MPCTLAFRGHQDQCFGLKLLFQPEAYARLQRTKPDIFRQLARGRGMYRDGPFWWRQVLEAAGVPYTQVAPSLWRISLGPTFLSRALPLFTLTTAVAGRRLRFDSYCALHVARRQLYVYEHEILHSSRESIPDFSGGGRRLARQALGADPLHYDAEPVSLSAGGSFRIRTGDLVGRLGYLTAVHPHIEWQSTAPSVRTRLGIEADLGVEHLSVPVLRSSMDMSPLHPGSDKIAMPAARAAVTPALLRRGALWGGGGVARLVKILHALAAPPGGAAGACGGRRGAPCKLWRRRRQQVLARACQLPPGLFASRMAVFARELMEYAGGDQMTSRKHLNGALFDGGRPPWYAQALLRDMRDTIMLTWLYSVQWDHVYRGTQDAHHRVMELPSPSMPEWSPPRVVLVLGDVHGSFHSLLRNLLHMQRLGYMDSDFRLRPDVMFVGLGDYVDYGPYGMEVLWTLLWLQLLNRKNVVLLGGNHEDVGQNEVVGGMPDNFQLELDKRFGGAWSRFKPLAAQLYRTMPRALKCRVGDYQLQFFHGCGTPVLHAMGEGAVSSEMGEQIAWADVHQKAAEEASSRGGNVRVYGTDTLGELLGSSARCAAR